METVVILSALFLVLIIQFLLYKKIQPQKTIIATRFPSEGGNIDDSIQQQNRISSLIVHDERNIEKVEFELVKDIDISKYKILPMKPNSMNEVQNLISNLVGTGANVGIASQMTRGLFKATAPLEKLMQLASGGYGSAIMKNGKIAGHAGFIKAGSTLFTPLIAFQIASMITGQYFLANITKQLNSIQEKLDELINLFHIERRAKLKKNFILLQEYARRKSFENEDFVLIKSIMAELLSVREEYFLMLEDMYEEFDAKFKSDAFSSLTQAKEIIKNVNKSGFLYKLNLALTADQLFHLAYIVEFHMNLSCQEPSLNRISIINSKINEFKNVKEDALMFEQTNHLYNSFKLKINQELQKAEESSIFHEDDIKQLKKELNSDFSEFDKERIKKGKVLLKNYKEVIEPFSKQHEIIIDTTLPEKSLIYIDKNR